MICLMFRCFNHVFANYFQCKIFMALLILITFFILGSGSDNLDSGHLCKPYWKRFLCGQLPTTQRQVRSFKETVSADLHTFIRDKKEAEKGHICTSYLRVDIQIYVHSLLTLSPKLPYQFKTAYWWFPDLSTFQNDMPWFLFEMKSKKFQIRVIRSFLNNFLVIPSFWGNLAILYWHFHPLVYVLFIVHTDEFKLLSLEQPFCVRTCVCETSCGAKNPTQSRLEPLFCWLALPYPRKMFFVSKK